MFYILNPNIALRTWWRVPYAYYQKGVRNARKLTKEEFEFLSLCDGNTDVPESDLVDKFKKPGFIFPCGKGEAVLDPWQKRECNNRYFPAMNWMITGKCNYNCLHCFNASDNAPLMTEFSLEEAQKLLDEARDCGINVFTITGGEPMCHKNFFEILEGICNRGMFVEELNTNGYYINDEILCKMKSIGCNPLIKISFDGIGHHDWLRNREGAEEDAIRAIKLCIKHGFRVKVQTNVHRRNLESIIPTARFLDELGVVEMRLIRTTEVPRWNENAKSAALLFPEYFDKMLEFAKEYSMEEHSMVVDIWQFLTLFPKTKSYRMRAVECVEGEYRDSIPVCRGNRGMIAVTSSGDVFPCMQMSGSYEGLMNETFGSVKEMGLKPFLQYGQYLKDVCTTVGELAEANEQCRNCPYFRYCVGGCRAISIIFNQNKLGSDPSKCLFFNGGYHKKIETILKTWRNIAPMIITQ